MRKKLFQGLVLSLLLTAGYAWVSFDKTVQVEIDGQPRAVRTYAGTVGGVLDHLHLQTGEHDLVAPAPEVKVKEGSRIVVRRGRQLSLKLNGRTRTVWVTALSVAEALDQLALRDASGAFVSASRSREIPLTGMAFEVRTPARVNILADGHVYTVVTTKATLREAFAQAHVKLAKTDKVSAPLTILPLDGLTVRVTRVRAGVETADFPIAFPVTRKPDPHLWLGETRVAVRGVPGVRVRTWRLTYTNRRLTARRLTSDKVVRKPVGEVVYYGTRRRTVDDLNWYALARCESGNNPRAIGGGGAYRGLYQFRLSTWYSVGGTGDPINASREEQTYRAKRLYLRQGRAPWPYCGRLL
ncbi:MAG TPA: ubiquitin-like domain-containing protein [Mycobacteriales bacterium]|nr:ubiquitin-like domain-containing protein [Mycobacteriales bacterium]